LTIIRATLKAIAIAIAIAMLKTKPIGMAFRTIRQQSGFFLDKNFSTSLYTAIPKESTPPSDQALND